MRLSDRRIQLGLAAAVVAGGMALRVWAAHRAGAPSFDEAFTSLAARLPLRELPGWLGRNDSHPPLDYVLRMPVARTDSAWVLRSPSLVVSALLLIGLSVWAGRRRTVEGWLTVAVMAVSPFAVHYGAEARLYAVALGLATGLLLVSVAWVEHPRPWHAVAMSGTLLVLSFTISTWPIAGLALLVLAGGRRDAVAWRWRAGCALAGLVWLPLWGLVWRDQLAANHASWIPTTGLRSVSGMAAGILTLKAWPVSGVAALVMVGIVVLAWPTRREPLTRVSLISVGVAVSTITLAGIGSHVVIARAVTVAVPAAAALVAVAIHRLLAVRRPLGPAAIALVGAIMVGSLGSAWPPSDGSSAQRLLARAGPGDVVATYPGWFHPQAGWRAGPASELPTVREGPDAEGFGLAGKPSGRVWVAWPDSYLFTPPTDWEPCSPLGVDGSWRLGCWTSPR